MLAVAGGLFWWNVRGGGSQASVGLGLRGDATGGIGQAPRPGPPAGVGSEPQPIGSPPPSRSSRASYVFLQPSPTATIRWPTTRAAPIHVVMNERTRDRAAAGALV